MFPAFLPAKANGEILLNCTEATANAKVLLSCKRLTVHHLKMIASIDIIGLRCRKAPVLCEAWHSVLAGGDDLPSTGGKVKPLGLFEHHLLF